MQYGVTLCGSFMRKECRNKWEGNLRYVKEFGSKEEVTQRFRLRTGSYSVWIVHEEGMPE